MSTNFYLRRNICPTCSHAAESLHIGKSSWGWTFNFQGYEELGIVSEEDWKREMKTGEIFDEYGEHLTIPAFWRLVDSKRGEKNHHATQYPKGCWTDKNGNSFDGTEFS